MQITSALPLPLKPISAKTVWNTGVVLLILVVPLVLPTFADPDLWGHLRFGLDTLKAGSVVQVDSYSYMTAGQRWINHEWLSEVLFALAYTASGLTGLSLLRLFITSVLIAVNFRYLAAHGAAVMRAALLLLLTLFALYLGIDYVRPQLFTYLFLLVVLAALVSAEHGQMKWLWSLPFIFALWANLHGGFLAGLGILFAWAFLHLICNRWRLWPILPIVLLSVLATLVNPYGADLLVFLLRTATVPRTEIVEWAPLTIPSVQGVAYLILVIIAVGILLTSRRRKSVPLIGLFVILALGPLIAVRNLPLFAIGLPLLIGDHLGEANWEPFGRVAGKGYAPVAAVLPLLTAFGLAAAASGNLGAIRLTNKVMAYPAAAVAVLKASGATGNLAVPFGWGEYVIWHLGPQVQVSQDGRRETVYPDDVYHTNLDFEFGTGNWDAVLTQYPTNMTLVSKQSVTFNLMKLEPGWELVYEDPAAAIFVPRGSPLAEKIRQAPRSPLPPDGDGLNFQ